jgi:hypothetical protein
MVWDILNTLGIQEPGVRIQNEPYDIPSEF